MIIKVSNKKQLNKFIFLVKDLYKDNQHFVCPIFSALKKELNHEVLKTNNYTALLCYQNSTLCGRIMYTTDVSKHKGKTVGYFSFFDCIDNIDVAKELFEYMENDLKGKVGYIEGTFSPYDPDTRRGILVKGFDQPHTMLTSYNYEYYNTLLEGCGYQKAFDTYSVKCPLDTNQLSRLERIANISHNRYRIKIDNLNKKNIEQDILDVHKIFEEATTEINYQEAPSIDTIKGFLKSFSFFIEPSLIKIAREIETNEPVGFCLTLLDINQIFKKTKGKLNIFTFFKLKKKITQARGMLQYVIPKYQTKGVFAHLFYEGQKSLKKLGITYFEGGTILEENKASWLPLVNMGGEISKIYRIYGKEI